MTRLLGLCCLLLLATVGARAEEVVLGLSQNRVRITADFDGSEILIFGAVKREAPILETPLEVIVTLAGPSTPVTIHRKARRWGIWVNVDTVEIDHAPSFYALATSGPVSEVLTRTEDLRHSITVPRAVRSVGHELADARAFSAALIRIREAAGVYQVQEGAVTIDQQTLFRTRIELPANLTEGSYATRIFLTREGRVLNQFETVIDVRKVGLERWLFALSRNAPLVYGVLSIVLAVVAGWAASALFGLIRR